MSHSFSEAPTVHFCMCVHSTWGFSVVKNPPANGGEARRGFRPWVRKILWRRKWHIAPVFLPGKLDGQRNLVGYILTQWNYVSCCIGPPKMNGSWWRVLTKRGPLEKGITNHFSILASIHGPTFQVPMQHCSLQHQNLLSPPDTSTTGYCFPFHSASLFLLEPFLNFLQ